ncbi:MAG: terminase small subunit [Gammaproteobacteria bacterium]
MPHAGGRPTKYQGEKTLKKVQSYIDSCENEFEDGKNGVRLVRCKIPTIEALSLYLGVGVSAIRDWRAQHNEFSILIGVLLAKQACALIDNGLAGYYNPTIAKVLLAKHGYREGIEHMGEDGGPMRMDISNALDKVYGGG